jgi:hypothetical protein
LGVDEGAETLPSPHTPLPTRILGVRTHAP